MNATDVRADFSEIINRVAYGNEHVVLTRRGKEVAALVKADDLKLIRFFTEILEDEMDIAVVRKRLADKKEVPIPYEIIRKELGLK